MSHPLYFKTPNSNTAIWIRFALLYLNECQVINNFDAYDEHMLSEETISSDTDFYCSSKINESEVHSVSQESIIFLEDIKANANRYLNVLHFSSDNKYYQDINNKIFTLNEKWYCPEFINYCLENKFATISSGKIRVSMAVAMLYNKFFAQELARKENSSLLIDDPIFFNVLNYIRDIDKNGNGSLNILKSVNSLVLPDNIEMIPLSKIRKFRNDNRPLIKLFNEKLSTFYTDFKEGTSTANLCDEYNDVYFELTNKILTLGRGVQNIPHTTYFESAENLKDTEMIYLTDKMGLFIVDKINENNSSSNYSGNFSRRHLFNLSASKKTRLF